MEIDKEILEKLTLISQTKHCSIEVAHKLILNLGLEKLLCNNEVHRCDYCGNTPAHAVFYIEEYEVYKHYLCIHCDDQEADYFNDDD